MTITYERWIADNERNLRELEGKDLIMAFSGGKDSTVVLHFLDQARKTYNFNLEARGIVIPAHVLTGDERDRLDDRPGELQVGHLLACPAYSTKS